MRRLTLLALVVGAATLIPLLSRCTSRQGSATSPLAKDAGRRLRRSVSREFSCSTSLEPGIVTVRFPNGRTFGGDHEHHYPFDTVSQGGSPG